MNSAPTPGAPASPVRVLIVDDEPRLRESLARVLRARAEVETAGTVAEALDILRSGRRFDLILSDVMMQGETGLQLHETLARELPAAAARMVFMTGGLRPPLDEALARLPNLCLDKPIELGAVVALLDAASAGPADDADTGPVRSSGEYPRGLVR